jgi:putative protein kinase ArgK-like GTPase of G3E family
MDLATERRTGQPIDVDVGRPRAIGIFGKRGSGKTTTLIEIAGAAAKLSHLVIIVDPLSAIRPATGGCTWGRRPKGRAACGWTRRRCRPTRGWLSSICG